MTTGEIISRTADLLWMGGLAATPLALVVGGVCRWRSLRPSTRHLLWFAVLASFVTPVLGALLWTPQWFRSDQLIAAADTVLPKVQAPVVAAPEPKKTVAEPMATPSPRASIATRPEPEVRPSRETDRRVAFTEPSSITMLKGDDAGLSGTGIGGQPTAWNMLTSEPAGDRNPIESGPYVGGGTLPGIETARAIPIRTERVESSRPITPPVAEAAAAPAAVISTDPVDSSVGGVRSWLVRLLGVRDAIAALPRVPGVVWLGGAVILMSVAVVRTLLAGRWINRATPAGPEVQLAVRQVGDALGLSKVPTAYFVDAAVSPMIWCGLRPRLVLPTRLWYTLDHDARRAVLVHELAHVRRGDHVVCWVQAAIGAVYWWHPVVWWARRRLHDEAEASCDAWVTSLFPSDRRAYASALLTTKSYVSLNERNGGLWLGVVSSSAKRLARRITMVMTERTAPGMSVVGACVAALVLTAGTFVMPGLACPPECESSATAKVTMKKGKMTTTAPAAVGTGGAGEPLVTFFGEAPALDAMRGAEPGGLAPAVAPARAPKAPKAPKAPRSALPAVPAAGRLAPVAPLASFPSGVSTTTAPADLESLKVGRTAQKYAMSGGKVDCFYSFMSRSDVPILVEHGGGHITMWGTADEHAVFAKFITIVGAEGGASSQGGPAVNVTGSGVSVVEGERYLAAATAAQGQHAARLSRAATDQHRAVLEELSRSRDAFEADAEKVRDQAEEARERAETMRELAEDLSGRAGALSPSDERKELEAVAKRLHARSDALDAEATSMEERVSRLEKQLEEIEARADALEEKIDELDSESDLTEDEADEMIEAPEPAEATDAPEAPEVPEAAEAPAAAEAPEAEEAPASTPSAV